MERRAGGSERIRGTYVYGTEARQLNTALPKTDYDEQRAKRRREQEEKRQQERLEGYKALKHAHKTNLLYTFAAVAVAATLILPLKSTLMFRFLMASNLDACSDLYAGVGHHIDAEALTAKPFKYTEVSRNSSVTYYASHAVADIPVDKELLKALQEINKRLLAVRPHIAATASETGLDKDTIETIQRAHRNIIGTIDLLLTAAPRLANIEIDEENHILLIHYQHELTQAMRHMAAVLRSPSDEVFRPITRIVVSDYPSVQHLAFEWQGYFWLTQTLQAQLQQLSDLLQTTKPRWFSASGVRYQRREQRRIEEHGGETDLHL